MNIRPPDNRDLRKVGPPLGGLHCYPHPHRSAQHLLHGYLLGNQIDLHRCLPPGHPQGVLLGNHRGNHKPKSDNPRGLWPPCSAELEAPLTKRQLKRRQNKDSKLTKKFVSLDAEISNLKSQMDALEGKIMRASKSTNAGFKRKKIRSMKREADKIAEKLRESEKALRAVEPRVPKDPISGVPLKLHLPNRNKCIETKIAELNKKIRRAKYRRNKERLIANRDALQAGAQTIRWSIQRCI